MPKYRVSQGELWNRHIDIVARSLSDAIKRYEQFKIDGIEGPDVYNRNDAEFVDEIEGDVVWFNEGGMELNPNGD